VYIELNANGLSNISKKKMTFAYTTCSNTCWNQLPAEVLGTLPCKSITFKKRVRKVIIELN